MFKIRAKVKKWLNIHNIDEVPDQTVFANIAKIESMLNHIQNNLIILCKENISRAELLNMIRDSVVQRNEFSVLENLKDHPASQIRPGGVLNVARRKQIVYTN